MASGRASPGSRPWSSRLPPCPGSYRQHRLADNLALGQLAQRDRQLCEGPYRMDDGLEAPGGDHVEQLGMILDRPAVRAGDVELERPDIPDVSLRIVAGSGAAGQQPALPLQSAEALSPGITAGVVDNDVNTARSAPGTRLAVEPDDLLHIVLHRAVDHMIGAELPQFF